MNITLFFGLEALAVILIFLGYYSKERAYSFLGFSFLFILGSWVIIPGQLTTITGETKTLTYTNSTLTSEITTYSQTPWNDNTTRFFGIYTALLGAIGFGISLVEIRRAI